jgi:hypothetical protein
MRETRKINLGLIEFSAGIKAKCFRHINSYVEGLGRSPQPVLAMLLVLFYFLP